MSMLAALAFFVWETHSAAAGSRMQEVFGSKAVEQRQEEVHRWYRTWTSSDGNLFAELVERRTGSMNETRLVKEIWIITPDGSRLKLVTGLEVENGRFAISRQLEDHESGWWIEERAVISGEKAFRALEDWRELQGVAAARIGIRYLTADGFAVEEAEEWVDAAEGEDARYESAWSGLMAQQADWKPPETLRAGLLFLSGAVCSDDTASFLFDECEGFLRRMTRSWLPEDERTPSLRGSRATWEVGIWEEEESEDGRELGDVVLRRFKEHGP